MICQCRCECHGTSLLLPPSCYVRQHNLSRSVSPVSALLTICDLESPGRCCLAPEPVPLLSPAGEWPGPASGAVPLSVGMFSVHMSYLI